MKPYKIFVISLPDQLDRRRFITKQLDLLKLDYTVFDAVNGSTLSQDEYDTLVDTVAIAPKLKWLTKGAIGCALSHYEVYKRIAQEDISFALVLEDDTILSDKLPQLLDSIYNTITEIDVILLNFLSGELIQLSQVLDKKLSDEFHLYEALQPNKLASTAAYVISKDASKKLASFIVPIKTSADHWGCFLENNVVKSLMCVYPMPVDTADFKSSIDYLDKDSFLGRLSDFIDKYKVFPAYQLLKYRRRRAQKRRKQIQVIQ